MRARSDKLLNSTQRRVEQGRAPWGGGTTGGVLRSGGQSQVAKQVSYLAPVVVAAGEVVQIAEGRRGADAEDVIEVALCPNQARRAVQAPQNQFAGLNGSTM